MNLRTLTRLLISAVAMLVAVVGLTMAPAQATDPPYPTYVDHWSAGYDTAHNYTGVTFYMSGAPANTTVTILLRGCNGIVVGNKTVTGQGNVTIPFDLYNNRYDIGAHMPAAIDLSAPGYSPYHQDVSVNSKYPTSAEANCSSSGGGGGGGGGTIHPHQTPMIKTWSAKRGVAHPGHRIYVTKTTAISSTKLQYTWTKGGFKIGTGRYLTVNKAWVGKAIFMTVKATHAGYTAKTHTLSYFVTR